MNGSSPGSENEMSNRLLLPLILVVLAAQPEGRGQSPGSPTREYIYLGARLVAFDTPTAAPTNLVATAASTTQVNLTWSAATGASYYRVERSFNNGSYIEIGTSVRTAYTDNLASPGITYLYRVRAVDGSGNVSGYSNFDLATTIMFTDDPLTAAVTVVKAQHFSELRQAVNAVRTSAGLGAAIWTDSSLGGIAIKAVHVQELRNYLGSAMTTLGLTAPTYTDPTLNAGVTIVKKVHVEELRQNVK